MKSAEI